MLRDGAEPPGGAVRGAPAALQAKVGAASASPWGRAAGGRAGVPGWAGTESRQL